MPIKKTMATDAIKHDTVINIPTMPSEEIESLLTKDWLRVKKEGGFVALDSKSLVARKKIAHLIISVGNHPMPAKRIAELATTNKREAGLLSPYFFELRRAGILSSKKGIAKGEDYFISSDIVKTYFNIKELTSNDIKAIIKNSAFSKNSYQVDIHLLKFIDGLMLFINDKSHKDISEIFNAVPVFQRDNDKWTESMQVSFIENILKGCKSTIMLYEVMPNDGMPLYDKCFILDGLQRLTAIHDFTKGKIKAFGKTYRELCDARIITWNNRTIGVRIYSFNSEADAIKFYIEMNENITHSASDIQKAKTILSILEGE